MPNKTLKPTRSAAKTLAVFLLEHASSAQNRADSMRYKHAANIFETLGYRVDTTYTFTEEERITARDVAKTVLRNPHKKIAKVKHEQLESIVRQFADAAPEIVVPKTESKTKPSTAPSMPDAGSNIGVSPDKPVSLKLAPTEAGRLHHMIRNASTKPQTGQKHGSLTKLIAQLETVKAGQVHASVYFTHATGKRLRHLLDDASRREEYSEPYRKTARHLLHLLQQRLETKDAESPVVLHIKRKDLDTLRAALRAHTSETNDLLELLDRV